MATIIIVVNMELHFGEISENFQYPERRQFPEISPKVKQI